MNPQLKDEIQNMINSSKVFIFMKGTPELPQCGFSMQTVALFKSLNVPFKSCNVLERMDIRQGIKEFSQWPTIPQVYINGTFVGGNDIIQEMHQNNELQPLVE